MQGLLKMQIPILLFDSVRGHGGKPGSSSKVQVQHMKRHDYRFSGMTDSVGVKELAEMTIVWDEEAEVLIMF